MCLAIPSRIISIDNQMAVIDVDGVQRIASLLLLEDAAVGDMSLFMPVLPSIKSMRRW